MVIKKFLRLAIRFLEKTKEWAEYEEKSIYSETEEIENTESNAGVGNVVSVWDFIQFKKGTQADHLTQTLSFDEWLSMDEIRYRINELLGIDYRNERSLYPYIKTLVDCGFLEASSVGGKRRWRKNEFLIEIAMEEEKKEGVGKLKKRVKIIS